MIKTDITGIGDPFILLHNGVYYLYATSASDGFKYWTSEDLESWTEGGYCYQNSPWAEGDFWAPEAYAKNGKFYLIYTARWKKNHSLRIGVAVADSPKGPFVDVKDGPLFDYGYAAIDATLISEGGKDYLFYVRDCSENVIDGVHTSVIYASEIARDCTALMGEPVKIIGPDREYEFKSGNEWRWNEGPVLLKRNGRFYLNYSMNFYASRDYSIGCAESDFILGPYEKYAAPVLVYREGDFSGPGHNSLFYGKDGRLYTTFHVHTNYDEPSGDRRACIAEAYFDEQGKMQIRI